MSLLETRNLDAFYGDFQALYSVSITVEAGAAVAIIGPNGAGKTTLLRSLAGWVPVKPGHVVFDGQVIGGMKANQVVRLGVGSVPEGRRLFKSLTVDENLLMGAESRRSGEWTLERVFEVFPDLKQCRNNLGANLSGGQQQMVAIGRALMSNPRLALFDELSLGLAPAVVNSIQSALPAIKESGIALILVEQDVKRALTMTEHAYCILEGRVTLEGASNALDFSDIEKAFFGAAA